MAQPVSVALCFDGHLALPAATVIASVTRTCSRPVHFYLFIDPTPGLARMLRAVLAHFGGVGTIVEAKPEAGLKAAHGAYGGASTATYRRLYLANLVPDIDRLIYLDSDVIVRHDLTELWGQPLDDHPLGAVSHAWAVDNETMLEHFPNGYFNAGVLLMDLARWRAQGIVGRLEDAVRASLVISDGTSPPNDEGPLNAVFMDNWQSLSPRWNFTAYFTDSAAVTLGLAAETLTAIRQDPGIMHFAGGYKPWLSEFAQLSPYHIEFGQLRAELEQSVDLGTFGWPGRFIGSRTNRRQRRLRALSLIHRARPLNPIRWAVVAKGLMAVDVLAVAREQDLDIAGVVIDNPLFHNCQFGGFTVQNVAEQIRRGCSGFLIADRRTAAATAAYVGKVAATLGADVPILV
jgi:lipopolysaccharide biosynthesis glycosyltransferase